LNSLLDRIASAEALAARLADEQGARALELLDWPRVAAQIAGFCLNQRAAERIRGRCRLRDLEAVKLHWLLADELRPTGEAGRWPPVVRISDGRDLLDRQAPFQLNGAELVVVGCLAEDLGALRDYFQTAGPMMPTWSAAARELATFDSLAAAIGRALDRDGRLLDSASTQLGRLRRACAAQEVAVRQLAEQAMVEARRRGWTTGPEVTLRGDRYCLPLRSGAGRKIDGIVHDRSASGGTLFVEPAPVVRPHNELAELRCETAAEEARILLELNRVVEEAAPALREACAFLLLVDEVRAGLLWSKEYNGRRPRLVPGGRLRLRGGRHPLLQQLGPAGISGPPSGPDGMAEPPERGAEVVPLDLELPADRKVVLLSGPNAGGKSVALKTVGVCVILAQCGWDILAREDSELPLVGELLVDLGDEQSIEKSLSSFSAHLGHLVRFLAQADAETLVLCDEIGSGTDPEEGTALAFTVLEGLAGKGATVLASTHFSLLKAAVADHPDMINAAMDYDEKTLLPLFTFRIGTPGASHAFDIAARWGFPRRLLARARELVGQERFQVERLLGELARRARRLARAEDELGARLSAQRKLEKDLSERLAGLAEEKERFRQRIRGEGERWLAEGRRLIERTVRELRSSGGDKVVIRSAKDVLRDLERSLPTARPPADPPAELVPGQQVRIPHLGLRGRVVEVRGQKVVAEAGGMRLTLTRDGVEIAEAGDRPEDSPTGRPSEAAWRWRDGPPEVGHEIDLRGQRGEEAWQQLDLLIDRAIPAGLDEILVIHGIGTGRLREYLHQQLAADGRVSRHEDAPSERGGYGVTIVHLSPG